MPNPGLDLERVTPQYMSDLADPLGDVYEAIVNRLLINVARHFAGGVARGRDMIPGSEQWRAWMLARLGALSDENFKIMAEMAGDVSGLTEQALRRAIYDALKLADKELAAKISAPGYVPTVEESTQNALDMYEAQALNRMNLVNTVLLNSSLEAYSKCVNDTTDYARKLEAAQLTLNRRTGEVIIGAQSFQQARRRAVLEMADAGLTGFKDRGGHNWSASAYVEMDMRTTALQAAREAVMKRNEEYGNDLIMVSSHPGARPGCEPYQGAIYSTTGRSGTVEDLHGKQLAFTPLSGTSYGEPAGLFGINCGHFSAPFIPGASVMRWPKYDKEESERLYKESQQQRYMERKVRKAKLEAEALTAAGDEEGAKEQRKKARELNRQLKDWCEDNGRDYYPDRVQIIRMGVASSGTGRSGHSGNAGNGGSNVSNANSSANAANANSPENNGNSMANTAEELRKRIDQHVGTWTLDEVQTIGYNVSGLVEQQYTPRKAAIEANLVRLQTDINERNAIHEQLYDRILDMMTLTDSVERAKKLAQLSSEDAANESEVSRLYHEQTRLKESLRTLKSDILLETLSTIRPFGGVTEENLFDVITPTGPRAFMAQMQHAMVDARTKTALVEALNYYPSEWITKSKNHAVFLQPSWTDGRARYNNGSGVILLDGTLEAGIHECAHRMEYVVGGIIPIEREFYNKRTAGCPLEPLGGKYEPHEMTRKDRFLDPYMGKQTNTGAFELTSMGNQLAFINYDRLAEDPDMQSMIFGIYATQ